MSLFSSFGNALFGVPPVNSGPYAQQALQAQQQAKQYAGREQGAYDSQQQLADNLWNTINGRGSSVADIRLQQALQQALSNGTAMGAGASGANAVLARYLGARGAGDQAAQAAQAGGLLRAQETQNAQQQYGNLTGAMAGESGNLYGTNLSTGLGYANLANSVDQANKGREQQAEAAGLSALGGVGSMYFGRSPGGLGGGGSSMGGLGSSDPSTSNAAWDAYS